eukprot:205886_1
MAMNQVSATSPHAYKETITKKSVSAAFESYKGEDRDIWESQIIHILGGIDVVLDEFLRETDDVHITQNQLYRLHQLFSTPQNKYGALTKLFSMQHDEDYIDFTTHIFDDSCTYLHDFLGNILATKILNILHSAWPHVIFFVFVTGFVVLRIWCANHIVFPLYTLICTGFISHFYVIFWLLSVNKKGIVLVMQTFEFWLKSANITIGLVLLTMNHYVLKIWGDDSWGNMNHKYLRLAGHITTYVNIVLIMITISMFDALHVSRSSKVICSVAIAIGMTVIGIYSEYNEYMTFLNSNDSMFYVTNSIGWSLLSLQQNAIEITAIFSWKQAILTIVKRGRCVLIKHSPYIEWKTDSQLKSEPTVNEQDPPSVAIDSIPDIAAKPTEIEVVPGAHLDREDTCTPPGESGLTIAGLASPGNESESNDIPLFFSS